MANTKIEEDKLAVFVDTKKFPVEIITAAAYSFIDKASMSITGNPEKMIEVKFIAKQNNDLNYIANEFNNALIIFKNSQKSEDEIKEVKEVILQKALLLGSELPPETEEDNDELDKLLRELDKDDDRELDDDPEGIAIPWEEKYWESDKIGN